MICFFFFYKSYIKLLKKRIKSIIFFSRGVIGREGRGEHANLTFGLADL